MFVVGYGDCMSSQAMNIREVKVKLIRSTVIWHLVRKRRIEIQKKGTFFYEILKLHNGKRWHTVSSRDFK